MADSARINVVQPHKLSVGNARAQSEKAMQLLRDQHISYKWISQTDATIGGPGEAATGSFRISPDSATLDITLTKYTFFADIIEQRIRGELARALRGDDSQNQPSPSQEQPTANTASPPQGGSYTQYQSIQSPQQSLPPDMGGFSYGHYFSTPPSLPVAAPKPQPKPAPQTQAPPKSNNARKAMGFGLVLLGLVTMAGDPDPKNPPNKR